MGRALFFLFETTTRPVAAWQLCKHVNDDDDDDDDDDDNDEERRLKRARARARVYVRYNSFFYIRGMFEQRCADSRLLSENY